MRFVRPVVLLGCVALAGYAATIVAGDPSWVRMAVWFLAGVVVHDALLLPLYAGADRALVALAPRTRVPVVNHVRVPVLGAGLTLLLFLPGIIGQGEGAVVAATGLDQSPFLGRWLLLVAALFAVSAVVYGVRVLTTPSAPALTTPSAADGSRPARTSPAPPTTAGPGGATRTGSPATR